MKIRFFRLILLALALTLPLVSCGKDGGDVRPGETSVIVTAKADGKGAGTLVKDGNRWTITSLDDWEEFDCDGNFSDNCLAFLRQMLESESDFLEFKTLKISDYKLVRDEEEYGLPCLYFEFTVAESGIDALPVGHHTAILTDAVDCFLRLTDTAEKEPEFAFTDDPYADAVCDWIDRSLKWELPAYGKAGIADAAAYLIERCGADGVLPYDDFVSLAAKVFGITVTKESTAELLDVREGRLCITAAETPNRLCNYVVTNVAEADGKAEVTVQFFADCNSFFKSHEVVYSLGKDGELYGCTVKAASPYRPYGLIG